MSSDAPDTLTRFLLPAAGVRGVAVRLDAAWDAVAGRADVMDLLAPLGPVYQAGTLSGNPLATVAGLVFEYYVGPEKH